MNAEIEHWKNAPVIVKKPVLHFYSKKKQTVRVKVSIPSGRPDAWWPPVNGLAPQLKFGPRIGKDGTVHEPPPIDSVEPKDGLLLWPALVIDPDFATDAAVTGWWKTARAVPSTPVRAENRTENFLFYDCIADFSPKAAIDWNKDGTVTITNESGERFPAAIAVRVKKGECFHASTRLAKGETASLTPAKGVPDLAALLATAGLTKQESAAIEEIWRDEFFKADGVRVLILLAREVYDRLLPIEIAPKPAALERVLLAQVECLDDDRVAAIRAWIGELSSAEIEKRDEATKNLRALGPLAEPLIRAAAEKATDPEVKARLTELLPKRR